MRGGAAIARRRPGWSKCTSSAVTRRYPDRLGEGQRGRSADLRVAVRRADRVGAQPRDAAARFLRTETGSAAILLLGAIAALVWVNIDASSYERVWNTDAVDPDRRLGHHAAAARLGQQRPDDVLLLRRRARGAARVRHGRAARAPPAGAAARRRARRDGRAGRDLPGLQRGPASTHGWGAAMSTDTAFALGMLALVGRASPTACARSCSRSSSSTTWWRSS